jgi:hypothetical protein
MPDHHRPFGGDRFGRLAERFARFFGTPKFIIGQTVIIMIWIAVNAAVVAFRWDPYPFILLLRTTRRGSSRQRGITRVMSSNLVWELTRGACPAPRRPQRFRSRSARAASRGARRRATRA